MSEAIAEMVLPGTYIEVRSEGLIGAAAISTGNLGVVGTAAAGVRNQVVTLSSYAEALDAFGPADPFTKPTGTSPLTLVRALQLAFAGGARNVWAVRIAHADPAPAVANVTVKGAAGSAATGFTMTAASAGTWGNRILVELENGGDTTAPTWQLTLSRGAVREKLVGKGSTVGDVHTALAAPGASRLVVVDATVASADKPFAQIDAGTPFTGGQDHADVTSAEVGEGLAVLEDRPVNLVLVAGLGTGDAGVQGAVLAHLETTENAGRDRIAVLGAAASGQPTDASTVVDTANLPGDDRLVVVAPGVVAPDAVTGAPVALPPPYLGAVVAGTLCSLAPHISLTNRALAVDRLDVAYSTATVKALLDSRVTIVRSKFGNQVVKGITTDAGAFRQISVRRTVDFAKAGVRSGADPYIGKLNNARVRAALKATLDGFLSQMVLDEMLVAYQLEVTATRAQEIQGIAAVAMTLQPTFSIDFIRVTITLQ